PAPVGAMFLDVLVKLVRVRLEKRHRQVSRQDVVKRRNISRALNTCMSTQCQNAAAGTANVSQQQLQNRRGSDDLDPDGMLGPAHGVADSPSFLWTRSRDKRLGSLYEDIFR